METGKPLGLMNQGREPVAKGPMKSLVAEGMHYIRMADGREELYFLKSDPEEQVEPGGVFVRRGAARAIPNDPAGDAQEAIALRSDRVVAINP